jgi:hypothetical protein
MCYWSIYWQNNYLHKGENTFGLIIILHTCKGHAGKKKETSIDHDKLHNLYYTSRFHVILN